MIGMVLLMLLEHYILEHQLITKKNVSQEFLKAKLI